jgi:hypothetical protein
MANTTGVAKKSSTIKGKHGSAAKMLALSVYAETLNTAESERVTGIPRNTVHTWVATEEGQAQIDSLRAAIRYQLAYKCVEVSRKAIEVIQDRLDHGDHKIGKDGELVRVPVTAKDAATIASMAIDKHALLTGTIDRGSNIQAGIRALAEGLEELGKARREKVVAG